LPETELGLEAHYFLPSTPPAERLEAIRALGAFQTVTSVNVLARIFAREKRLDAKMKVLEVVADNREDPCREGKLSILRAGVSDSQSRRVRLASLQALLDVDDPRLPQILGQLAKDQDSIIRSQAAEALKK
jgi:HEAT repeat protein